MKDALAARQDKKKISSGIFDLLRSAGRC